MLPLIIISVLFYLPELISASANDRPIIGILAQEENDLEIDVKKILHKFPDKNYDSYISASYVKSVEGSGGRVVPVFINKTKSYYDNLLNSLNGIILPGGGANFSHGSYGYGEAAEYIYELAKEINDKGIYFPVLGICLGLETLIYLDYNKSSVLERCYSLNLPIPLEFINGYETSRLFKNAPENIINILSTQNVTFNHHNFCVTRKFLEKSGLNNRWKVMSINYDRNGLEFISSMEHVKYPIYAQHFHPNDDMYEFSVKLNIPHSADAIVSSQYFYNLFVNECRKNTNSFKNSKIEESSLIYNYKPEYSIVRGAEPMQIYGFYNGGSKK